MTVNDFPLFLTSGKRPLAAFSDLYFRCVHYITLNIRRTLLTTWNYTYPNLDIACNKIMIFHKVKVPGPLLGRPPCGLILVTNTFRKRSLSLALWVVAYGRFNCIWHKEPYTTCFRESNFAPNTFPPHNNFCLCQYINNLDELKGLDLIYDHWCLNFLAPRWY